MSIGPSMPLRLEKPEGIDLATGGAVLRGPGRRGHGHPGAAGKMRRAAAGGSHAPGSLA